MEKQSKLSQKEISAERPQVCQALNLKAEGKKRGRKPKRKQSEIIDEIDEYFKSKKCQICIEMDREEEMLLCDRCDDSYHLNCLTPPLSQVPEGDWICPVCLIQTEQLQQQKKNGMVQQKESQCYKCKQALNRREIIQGTDEYGKIVQIQIKSLVDLTCLYCRHAFHNTCFGQRKNSLNCQACQSYIRRKGPKSHDEFMKYIENSIRTVIYSDFLILEHKQQDQSQTVHRYQRLKIPNYMTSWQFIVQYEASLFYAFQTKGLTFVDQQIYQQSQKELMKLNNPKRDVQCEVPRLYYRDERAYQEFKINSKKGFVGPFEIKQDRVKGFYLTATDYIQADTIVSEYAGEVMTSRDALNELENDSIFSLLRGARAVQSLDIVPQKYGNISRFFAGLNNSLKKSEKRKLENVKALRFSYKGRVRIVLHTSKPIQAGETLHFDYNGSPFQEYPTEHFVH